MAWDRKGGRLVRRGLRTDVTPSELPRRRRRRVRPKPHRHHLGSLPDDIAKRVFAFVAPPADPVPFLRILATDSAVRGLVTKGFLAPPDGGSKYERAIAFVVKQGDNGIVWKVLSYWRAAE